MKTVGEYEFDEKEKLGEGSFGVVYKGRHWKNSDQVVAIKKVSENSGNSISLPREAEILMTLSTTTHANIVALLYYEKYTNHTYFVMEFCNGGNLKEYLESKQKLDEKTIRIFLRQIAIGLKVAHDLHIVHRDLKPENIMLWFSGTKCPSPDNITLKIADFGIGRFLDDGHLAKTHCGTPQYMAPEIRWNRPDGHNYKADLWCVGIIAYECFVGSLPVNNAINEFQMPQNATAAFTNLLQGLLENDENKRFTLKQVFDHQFIGGTPQKFSAKKHPRHSLVPMQKGAIFNTVNGLAEVRFHLPKELSFTAKLKSNDKDEEALAGHIIHRVVGDVVVFTINAPSRGEFGLEICANDPEVDENLLYQCLIICNETLGVVEPLPTLLPGYLGPQSTFEELRLSTVSNVDPYIQTAIGEVQVEFSMIHPLCFSSELTYWSGSRNDDRSEYVLQQLKANRVTFFLKLPKTGFYKFQVHAQSFSDTSKMLPIVYNYLINCTNTQATLVPYPKQEWRWIEDGGYLHEPLVGQLQRNRTSKGSSSTLQHCYFKVDVPKANSVAVVIGEDRTQLDLKSSGAWEGKVNLEKQWGHESMVAIAAYYRNWDISWTLLEYSM